MCVNVLCIKLSIAIHLMGNLTARAAENSESFSILHSPKSPIFAVFWLSTKTLRAAKSQWIHFLFDKYT
jgi:hypothetical protein